MTTSSEKMQVFTEYYGDLHRTQGVEEEKMERFLDQLKLPTFTEDHMLSLQEPITNQETEWAIARLKGDKSPGVNGLSAEFFLKN